jgi:hypothetical protein
VTIVAARFGYADAAMPDVVAGTRDGDLHDSARPPAGN